MANTKFFFLEQGGFPDIFSHGGRCWKKLTRTSTTGDTIASPSGIFDSVNECRCDTLGIIQDVAQPACQDILFHLRATGYGISDISSGGSVVTNSGSVTRVNAADWMENYMSFDGTNYLQLDSGSVFDLSGDFTYELLFNIPSFASVVPDSLGVKVVSLLKGINHEQGSGVGVMLGLVQHSGGSIHPIVYEQPGAEPAKTTFIAPLPSDEVTLGAWTHIAFTRCGDQLKIFLDGTVVQQYTTTAEYADATYFIQSRYSGNEQKASMYIQDVRMSRYCVYSCGFGKLVDLLPDACCGEEVPAPSCDDVMLHIQQDGTQSTIVDMSPVANVIHKNGDVAEQTGSVFSVFPQGGQLYFDGTGDYLKIDDASAFDFNAEFTVDFWYYREGVVNAGDIDNLFSFESSNVHHTGVSPVECYFGPSAGKVYFQTELTDGTYPNVNAAVPAQTWTHIAVTRSLNVVYMYINGQIGATMDLTGKTVTSTTGKYLTIGGRQNLNLSNMYMHDFRISKGNTYKCPFPLPTTLAEKCCVVTVEYDMILPGQPSDGNRLTHTYNTTTNAAATTWDDCAFGSSATNTSQWGVANGTIETPTSGPFPLTVSNTYLSPYTSSGGVASNCFNVVWNIPEIVDCGMDLPNCDSVAFHLRSNDTNPTGPIVDSSQYNNITYTDATTTADDPTHSTVDPVFGSSSLYFDGSDKLRVYRFSALNIGAGDFTIEFWMKFDGLNTISSGEGAGPTILSTSDNSNNMLHSGWNFTVSGNNSTSHHLSFIYEDGSSSTNWIGNYFGVLNVDQWYHVAVCGSEGQLRCYLDGAMVASRAFTAYADSANDLQIGQSARHNVTGNEDYFKGWLQDVRICTTALYTHPTAIRIPTDLFPTC